MNQANKFCKKCGCPLKDEDIFCKNCGNAVNNQQETNNNQQTMHNQGLNDFHQSMNNQPMRMNNRHDNITYNQSNNTSYSKQSYNFNSNQNNSNQNGSWKYAVTGIIVLILISVGIYFLINMNNNSSNNSDGTTNNNSSNNSSNNTTNSNSYGGNTESNSTKNVSFNGFTFKVPTGFVHDIDGDTLSFGDSADTWYAGVQVLTGEYSRLISNKSQVIAGIERNGYKVNTYDQKTYSGMECITMEVSGLGQNMIIGYVKANSSQIFVVSVLNTYKDYDYSLFADTIKVLKTGV